MTDAAAEAITNFPRRASMERLGESEHSRRVFWFTAPAGTTIDDLMTPAYWSRVASRLKPLDRVEVCDDEMTYFAEFIVLAADSDGLRLAPLRGVDLQGTGARDGMPRAKVGVQATYKGAFLKWCAYRGDVLLKDKFETERACLQWISANQKAQQS